MTEPPTLVLWEADADAERTLVDRAKHEAKRTGRTRRSLRSSYKREMIEVSAALAVLVGLGSVVYQQCQIAGALRETLAEIRAPRQETVAVRSDALPRLQETSTLGEVGRRTLIKELAADEREALERQAAALIASNDFPAALSQYETLTELFPDDRTLRDVVTVLRSKLRCDPSAGFASGSCR